METEIKKQLIKSVDNIKNKIKIIQNEEDDANLKFKKVFKPITDNLETMINGNEKEKPTLNVSIDMSKNDTNNDHNFCSNYEDFTKNILMDSNDNSQYYDFTDEDRSPNQNINDTLMSLDKEELMDIYDNNLNVPFGIRCENKNLMMGNSKVTFSSTSNTSTSDKNYLVTIGDKRYELTPGLRELLMCNRPNFKLVCEKDMMTYKDILQNTNAHKRHFNAKAQIKGDKGLKYRKIIKPLFSQQSVIKKNKKTNLLNKTKSGGFIPLLKKYRSNTDYIFWDDPNELIERLKLLIASKSAGNTNHDNEILSIIEELKEAGIVKE